MASNQLSDTGQTNPYASSTTIPGAPVAPDTSYNAWARSRGIAAGQTSGLAYWLNSKLPSNRAAYESWKTKQENQYNQDLANWQTFINSPEFQKLAYTSAGYNANYADPSAISPGSPGSYQTSEAAGPQGSDLPTALMSTIQTALQVASGIQGLQMGATEIAGKKIENSFLATLLGKKSNLLSVQTQAGQLSLQKLMTDLFGAENVPKVVQWLNGYTDDIDTNKYKAGAEQLIAEFLKDGPYSKMLGANLNKVAAQTSKMTTEEQLTELKKTFQGNENEWQEFEKGYRATSGVLGVIMQFVQLFAKML